MEKLYKGILGIGIICLYPIYKYLPEILPIVSLTIMFNILIEITKRIQKESYK